MNIVLLSGGSGRRLWPLSNDICSKQFIKIFRTNDDSHESMLQRVYKQIKKTDKDAVITIATSEQQVSAIYEQLGKELNISVEPCRKDTFPAIALATFYLRDVLGVSGDETVVVCPVDLYVHDEYFIALKELDRLARTSSSNILMMGIEPAYPSEKYGYIIPESSEHLSAVKNFKEKPDLNLAMEYIRQGALWNSGVFAYRLKYVLDKSRELIGVTDYNSMLDRYDTLEKISFDYAVVEKEKKISVMRFAGEWKDLGTWNTLWEAMEEKTVGKVILDEECGNVNVINKLDIPILCMGLKDVVVSATPEGILISDKARSSYIKQYVESIDEKCT